MELYETFKLKPQKAEKEQWAKIGTKNKANTWKSVKSMVDIILTISQVILNVSGLNIPI